jgi:hypothetical protein
LEASTAGETLLVEVKGLSGSSINVELTPNELKKMTDTKHRPHYVVYIVTGCLTKEAVARSFRYIDATRRWEAEDGRVLKIKPMTGAVLSC